MQTKTFTALLGLIIGIACGELLSFGTEIAVASLSLSLLQYILYFFVKRQAYKKEHQMSVPFYFSTALLSGIFFCFVAVGIIRTQFVVGKNNVVCSSVCTFVGVIDSSPAIKDGYQVFSVTPNEETSTYDVQIKTPVYPRYKVGETVSLSGKVSLPENSVGQSTSRTFDYVTYLRIHNIGSEMFYPKIEILNESISRSTVSDYLQRMREHFVITIDEYVTEPVASLAGGMLFGSSSMSKELLQTFRTAGLSHIIVLSGFNVAILISAVLFLLAFLPLVIRLVLAALFVVLFVVMVGAEASIVRATIMSFIALSALMYGRAYTASQALLLSLFLISIYNPDSLLYDPSLHLSFLATAGIVYMSEGLQKIVSNRFSKTYQEIIATTLAAYLATLPYMMYTFGAISLYSLFANILVLPLVPIVMLFTFLVIVASPLPSFFSSLLGYTTTLLGGVIIFIAKLTESLPFSRITISVSFTMMCFLYGVTIVGYLLFKTRKKDETKHTEQGEIISGILSY